MKTILIQQVYPKYGYLPLVQSQFKRNTDYCEKFGVDYQFHLAEHLKVRHGGWDKVNYIKEALKYYELVVWLDSDAILFDTNRDVREVPLPEDSIGAVRFQLPVSHLNVGVLYAKPGNRMNDFMYDWIADFPGLGAWREQAVFNFNKKECVVELPLEWNRNFDHSPYAKPFVMGFHGFGDADNRLALMKKALEKVT